MQTDPLAYLALVHAIARTLYRGTMPLEDLVEEGVLGLIKAAAKYDPARGRPAPYFGRKIRWSMIDALIRHRRQTARQVQEGQAALDKADDSEPEHSFELEEWLDDLTVREHRILSWWLGIGGMRLTYPEIAALEGVTRQRIQQIVQESLDKVRAKAAKSPQGDQSCR